MNPENDVFAQIAERYNSMSPVEQKISNYLLQHKTDIYTMSISELAKACDVGSASLTRFVRSLGHKSFSEFRSRLYAGSVQAIPSPLTQEEMIDLYEEVHPGDSVELKCQKLCHICTEALHQTQKSLDPKAVQSAVEILRNAKSVYCFGQGNSSAAAYEAWARFVPITTKFHWLSDSHLQAHTAALLEEDEVVLYFSFSGTTRELVENARLISKSKGKLILVTRFPNSPGTAFADVVLICGTNESPENQGSVAVMVGQLLIIDLLFNEYCSENAEQVMLNRKKTLDATEEKMLRRGKT